MPRCLRLIALTGLVVLSTVRTLSAAPTITEERVNGYRVILIDTKKGNGAFIRIGVPYGSSLDDPIHHAGRAHLWEHIIFRGNERYPNGEERFKELGLLSGGDVNAATGNNETYYHAYTHPDALDDLIDYFGALMSGPSWNQKDFDEEKPVVMKEVANYQAQWSSSLNSSAFLELLPDGHPLKAYNLGTQQQLKGMTLEDLKDLYYTNYKPEYVNIVIAGNFSSEHPQALNEEHLLKLIAEKFNHQKDLRPKLHKPELNWPGVERHIPGFGKTTHILEVDSKSENRYLLLRFHNPLKSLLGDDTRLEVLMDYLNLNFEGSMTSVLKDKKNLIRSFGIHEEDVGDANHISAYFNLTKVGSSDRYRVAKYFFATLGKIAREGIDENILTLLKAANVSSYSRTIANAKGAGSLIGKAAYQWKDSLPAYLNFEERYQNVTNADLQRLARSIFPLYENLQVTYTGPDVVSEEKSKVFDRGRILVPADEILKTWEHAQQNGVEDFAPSPRFPDLPISFTKEILQPTAELTSGPISRELTDGNHVIIDFEKDTTDTALMLEVSGPLLPPKDEVALSLFTSAFAKRYANEMNYLNTLGLIPIGLVNQPGSSSIRINLEGNRSAVESSLRWFLPRLRSFEPTKEELAFCRQGKVLQLARVQDRFPAQQVSEGIDRTVIHQYTHSTKGVGIANNLSDEAVLEGARRAMQRMDISITAVGNYDLTEAEKLMAFARDLFPTPLSKADRERKLNQYQSIDSNRRIWNRLKGNKAPETMGIMSAFPPVPLLSREHAALAIFAQALDKQISSINRARESLGYIHGAHLATIDRYHTQLRLSGETEEFKNWPKIERGWREVAEMVDQRILNPDDFLSGRLNMIRAEDLETNTLSGRAAAYHSRHRSYGDLNAIKSFVNLIRDVTTDEIYDVGQKVLRSPNRTTVVLSAERPGTPECGAVFD